MTARHGRTARLLAAALACLVALPALAAAHDRATRLSGTAISRLPDDTRRLTVKAQSSDPAGAAAGRVGFAHRSPAGLSHFKGEVSCLRVSGDVVQLSGTVRSGETAAGMVLTGRAFAFTIVLGDEQAFSLPRFGETLEPCSGGRPEQVPVTQGGLRLR